MPFSPHRAEPEPLVDLTNTPEVLRCSKPTRGPPPAAVLQIQGMYEGNVMLSSNTYCFTLLLKLYDLASNLTVYIVSLRRGVKRSLPQETPVRRRIIENIDAPADSGVGPTQGLAEGPGRRAVQYRVIDVAGHDPNWYVLSVCGWAWRTEVPG